MKATVKWNGKVATARARAGAARGLKLAAEHVLEEANRLVPLDEGTLFESGTTDVDEGHLRASVSYDTPYACRQHEEMTWWHAPGRQAKYLEDPINDPRVKREFQHLVSREVKEML